MNFWKYHGLGNDFVIVDAGSEGGLMEVDRARRICDRNTGVGADGVLTVLPSELAHYRMHIYNADGSEPEMCGNGIRCFVKYLVEKRYLQQETIEIETGKGVVACRPQIESSGKVDWVTVQMGPAVFERSAIPMQGFGDCIDQAIEVDDRKFNITALSLGNPHVVILDKADMEVARKYGPLLENHKWFPHRTNVEFAEIKSPNEIDLIVYERGCGITQACGTGACAATVAAARSGKVELDREIQVHLKGGSLYIHTSEDLSSILMRGPAVEVFYGEMVE